MELHTCVLDHLLRACILKDFASFDSHIQMVRVAVAAVAAITALYCMENVTVFRVYSLQLIYTNATYIDYTAFYISVSCV